MITNRAYGLVFSLVLLNLPSLRAFADDVSNMLIPLQSVDDSIKIPGFGVACQDPAGAAVHIYPLEDESGAAARLEQDQREYGRVAITLTSVERITVSNAVHLAKHTVSVDGAEMYVFMDWLNPDETARLVLPQPGDLNGAFFVFDFDAGDRYKMPQRLHICQLN